MDDNEHKHALKQVEIRIHEGGDVAIIGVDYLGEENEICCFPHELAHVISDLLKTSLIGCPICKKKKTKGD